MMSVQYTFFIKSLHTYVNTHIHTQNGVVKSIPTLVLAAASILT